MKPNELNHTEKVSTIVRYKGVTRAAASLMAEFYYDSDIKIMQIKLNAMIEA